MTTRWIRKTLLQAQGYHEGSTQLWLQKRNLMTTSFSQQQTKEDKEEKLKEQVGKEQR